MKTNIFFIIIFFSFFQSFGQDTIYSYPYPKGIITDKIETSLHSYKCHPIDNPLIEIVINKKETSKISFASGETYINKNYQENKYQVFPYNPLSGKINYSGILHFPDIKKKDLYQALIRHIPKNIINFKLVLKDESDFSFQKYYGNFFAYFAGDQYTVYFTLEVSFKDGKIKYDYSDFNAIFIKQKVNQFDFIAGSTIRESKSFKNLSKFYGRGARKSDNKKFWSVINNNIIQNIKELDKIFVNANPERQDDW